MGETWWQTCRRGLLDLIYPPACLLCDCPIEEADRLFSLCRLCHDEVTTDPFSACPRCASTIGPHTDTDRGCPECLTKQFRFTAVRRMGPYQGRLRDAILRSKFLPGESLAESLGGLFAERLREDSTVHGVDVVIPVPLHWRRRWARGYNQSAAVALGLAEALRLPCQPGWLRRTRNTPPQFSQSAQARRDNVRGAFAVPRNRPVRNLRVLLVDDVLTTGATANAASQALCEAGVAQVVVAVLAHR